MGSGLELHGGQCFLRSGQLSRPRTVRPSLSHDGTLPLKPIQMRTQMFTVSRTMHSLGPSSRYLKVFQRSVLPPLSGRRAVFG